MTQATEQNNLLSRLDGAIDSVTLNQVRHTLNNLSPPDIAHQLETAPPKFRRILWELVDPEISGEVLQELSDEIQLEFLDEMDSAEVASLTEGLDVDDIVDQLGKQIDLVLDANYCGSEPTTVVEFIDDMPEIMRTGLGDPTPFEID